MKVESRKLADIKPYPNNPRINDNSVELVANSIREFGFKNPIIVDKDGVIIAGHTRYKAAKQLRLKEVPVIVADDLTEGGILGNVTHCISLEDAKALYQELGLVIACLDREAQ